MAALKYNGCVSIGTAALSIIDGYWVLNLTTSNPACFTATSRMRRKEIDVFWWF
jgi:hypothetical protein